MLLEKHASKEVRFTLPLTSSLYGAIWGDGQTTEGLIYLLAITHSCQCPLPNTLQGTVSITAFLLEIE